MKKRIRLVLFAIMCVVLQCTGFADNDKQVSGLVYIEPQVARIVIQRIFSNMVSSYAEEFESELDDSAVLKNVVDAYNDMLAETGGFVSVGGVNHICDVAFQDLKPKNLDAMLMLQTQRKLKCLDFAKGLATTRFGEGDCLYSIKKVNGSQMHIRYTNKSNDTGFNRNGGSIAWRFLNPGALRDSPYKCVILNTKPNGDFAAFDSYEKGRFAIRWLLENTQKYQGKTPREAIPMYAPKKENNTKKYIRDLEYMGLDVDKKLSELTEYEWGELLNAIEQIEGWNNQGEIQEF